MLPLRLRDFIEDHDGWLYAVSTYDNTERVGCILRYIPDPHGDRINRTGTRYRKLDFEPAFKLIEERKPHYLDIIHRVPLADVKRIYKPEIEIPCDCIQRPPCKKTDEIIQCPHFINGVYRLTPLWAGDRIFGY